MMPVQVEMPSTVFRLIYDGEAVRDGEMDVTQLAPALLAVGQMTQAAGRLALGDKASVQVKVKTVQEGSFDVWLGVGVQYWKVAADILTGPDVSAARTIIEILFGGTGLVRFVLWAKGKIPSKIDRSKPGFVTVWIDGIAIEVPELVFRLGSDPNVRAALERTIADPLSNEGIEEVEFRPAKEEPTKITKAERHFFIAPPVSVDGTFETNHTKVFSIVSLSFKHGSKWKLSDGHGAPKPVTMLDADFLARVDSSEVRFAKGDVLICEVRETSRQTSRGLKAEYEIIRVIEHRPAGDGQGVFVF